MSVAQRKLFCGVICSLFPISKINKIFLKVPQLGHFYITAGCLLKMYLTLSRANFDSSRNNRFLVPRFFREISHFYLR